MHLYYFFIYLWPFLFVMKISVVPLSVKLSSKSTFNLQIASLLLGNMQLALGVLDCIGLMPIIFSLHIQSNLKIMFSNKGEAKHVIRDWLYQHTVAQQLANNFLLIHWTNWRRGWHISSLAWQHAAWKCCFLISLHFIKIYRCYNILYSTILN